MISKKLQHLFLLSIILWIAHGIEELATGFSNVDPQVKVMFGFAEKFTTLRVAFLVFQIVVWLILVGGYLLIHRRKVNLWLMVIPGFIMIYELYHLYKVVEVSGYYPGLITALFFPVLAFFFWRELLKNFKVHG